MMFDCWRGFLKLLGEFCVKNRNFCIRWVMMKLKLAADSNFFNNFLAKTSNWHISDIMSTAFIRWEPLIYLTWISIQFVFGNIAAYKPKWHYILHLWTLSYLEACGFLSCEGSTFITTRLLLISTCNYLILSLLCLILIEEDTTHDGNLAFCSPWRCETTT